MSNPSVDMFQEHDGEGLRPNIEQGQIYAYRKGLKSSGNKGTLWQASRAEATECTWS